MEMHREYVNHHRKLHESNENVAHILANDSVTVDLIANETSKEVPSSNGASNKVDFWILADAPNIGQIRLFVGDEHIIAPKGLGNNSNSDNSTSAVRNNTKTIFNIEIGEAALPPKFKTSQLYSPPRIPYPNKSPAAANAVSNNIAANLLRFTPCEYKIEFDVAVQATSSLSSLNGLASDSSSSQPISNDSSETESSWFSFFFGFGEVINTKEPLINKLNAASSVNHT